MPADIHALEIEFAKNPTLDACLPLCDAYLAAKRYMEAMVVCKKGIKNAAPTDSRGRVMLARVYLEQGKLPRAEQEMTQVMADFPGAPPALELMGRILMDQGKKPEAAQHLQQALQADPNLAKARAWLTELGVAAGAAPGAPAAAGAPAPKAAVAVKAGAAAAARPAATPGAPPVRAVGAPPPAAGAPPPAVATPAAAAAAHGHGHIPAETAAARPLEHVSDFFAPDALGFSNEASSIETAGPGRLTILGFVPKNTGSIKTTIMVFLAFLAVGTAFILYQWNNANHQRLKNDIVTKIRKALDEDRYARYKEVLTLGDKILHIDENEKLTLSMLAYAEAVLAVEHREPGALEKAQQYSDRATKASKDENEFAACARALLAYAGKNYDKGIADMKAIQDKGGTSGLIELEAFRLMDAARPDDKDTKVQLRRLVTGITAQSRALAFLGWYYYNQEDWGKSGKYFDQALQNAKGHPMALLGRSLVALDQGIGLEQKQKDVDKDVKEVLALPADEISPPMQAMALFTRAQLEHWQSNVAKADEDFKAAVKLDPDNVMFSYRRGMSLLKSGDGKGAVAELRKVAGSDPNNPKYLKKLAEAQTKGGMFADAKASLEKAGQLAPKDYDVHLLLGALAMAQHDYETALKQYEQISREDGGEPYTLAQLAISEAMRETGDKPKAVKHMEDFLSKIPEGTSSEMQSKLWCELGQAYEGTKNKAKATQSYQVGIEQYRFYADCHFFLCRVLGKGPESKEACKGYLTLEPRGRYAAEAQKHVK